MPSNDTETVFLTMPQVALLLESGAPISDRAIELGTLRRLCDACGISVELDEVNFANGTPVTATKIKFARRVYLGEERI